MRLLIPFAAALLAACAPAERSAEAPPAGATLLVGNKGEDTLSFIDLASGRELARLPTGRMPHEIAVSPDGRQAAVVAYGGTTIDIFDVRSRTKLRTIDLSPNAGPHGLIWLDDGRLVATTERSQSLAIVDTRRNDALSTIRTDQQGTHMVAVSADARFAYTANIPAGTVTVVDLAARRKLRDIQVGGAPEGIALSCDGRTLWVADLEGARVQAFDASAISGSDEQALRPAVHVRVKLANGTPEEIERAIIRPLERELRGLAGVTELHSSISAGEAWTIASFAPGAQLPQAELQAAIRRAGASFPKGRSEVEVRPLSTQPLATVRTGGRPIRVAASPDGRWIATSNLASGSLTVIDAATRQVVREVPVSGTEQARQVTILFSPDGRRVYAAETGRDEVAEVDFSSGTVLRRLKAGKNGDGLAIATPR